MRADAESAHGTRGQRLDYRGEHARADSWRAIGAAVSTGTAAFIGGSASPASNGRGLLTEGGRCESHGEKPMTCAVAFRH